ncbi:MULTISPECIES: Asp-tRNA(Asn)/Glu-tRNA(Gln) amidotransferase subunit GatC [Micrococcus]|uniref:Asp-tRNA(Asn)/Glu-tRNA(Gln) amidotransferase subunit GatC n=1 Tax=Micrococcus TaxID=1269 RepID=UPI000F44F7F8|nr:MULTISPECIES: Asp-tRNA(Asn)/Glu-tRNA(Gln) amidotransferase subunit GatC [Micrococcus]MCC0766820.1 Asp-tRNA(Asn)/Glu-tRNA(Gln) amidotransferase subunit GatC [Micrococcus luteus]MCV7523650.1 Asp-tRNA(Asn)/Glu-tRNA(Gln) amidotransferase subunit GatC [Micrococcus luteus]MCV7623599.1 Asp-tRNA(Asn)/Glu-tRNA(Gln) amidotransferase subunit GatC [Micrococcus luteus]RNM15404.1 Asp-tRNA(Asn)/Glu-tRNA(Gln) amidotransferase subunit GatC [Micrococcus sp. RIT608]
MPEITRDQVEHLARLAHIRMTDEELDTMSGDLEKILEHVSAVQAAAGDDVTPTSHPIALENVFREDVPAGMLTQVEALDQAPDSEDGQFKVPAILDGE